MAEKLNIYQKLAKVRKAVEVVQKNKAGYGYRYVSDDELLAKITGEMDKQGLSLIPETAMGDINVKEYNYTKYDKKEKADIPVSEILVSGNMLYTWINNDAPEEKVPVSWFMVGQQADASQAFGSGLTYSYRYFLLKFFGVATPEDDPDNWRSKQKESEAEMEKSMAEEITKGFDEAVKLYLSSYPEKKDEVLKMITKYVKSGNYLKITEPALASKLYNEFKETYLTPEN